MLTPISSDLFSVVNAGADLEQMLLLTINDINDVANAPRSTTLTPKVPDDNTLFLRRNQVARGIREGMEPSWGLGPMKRQTALRTDPESAIGGRDSWNAARDGYVFRNKGQGRMTLLKREKDLVLNLRPAFINSPEMQEAERIFRLIPGQSMYKIKSELTEEAIQRQKRSRSAGE